MGATEQGEKEEPRPPGHECVNADLNFFFLDLNPLEKRG